MKKSNGTLYWTGLGWDPLLETDLSGNATEEYVFFNGERVARVDMPANTVEYYFSDHLKSTDIVTNATGGIVRESDYVPYGGEVVISGTDPNRYKFTGKERDPESGLDDFDARFYSSPFGRFMTPDWEAKPTDVPYANFGNPQSLNLYSYVQNNPTTLGDPDGHCCDFNDVMNFSTGLLNAWGSDNLLGAGRQEQTTTAGKIGAAFGDTGATIQGAGEALFGGGEALVTSPAAATGVGVLVPAVGVGIAIHGSATSVTGFSNLLKSANESTPATEPYKRPSGATTPEQRQSVQGKPCVDCGKTETKMNANHKTPLVKEHYETGKIDKTNMRSLDAVNSHCPTCSNKEGGRLSQFSKKMKKLIKSQ